jgi:23S rRNA pseudouridine1911/1915/1917 synthase
LPSLVAPPSARGERLDRFLAKSAEGLSRARLQALIDAGQVTVDGAPAHKALKLKGGEAIAWQVPAPAVSALLAEDLPLAVVYQDKDLLVVNKAAGMVVHPGAGHATGTLANAVLHRVKDLGGVGGALRPGLVHRLDKDTSGLLVIAKHDAALATLQAAFKAREVEKIYLALVAGRLPAAEGVFRTLHGRHPRNRQKFSSKVKTGKPAVTRWVRLEQFPKAALAQVHLETGRTHQIRVHFCDAGHPLLGDALYGGRKQAEGVIGRQALHAQVLAFAHPRTGKPLRFEVPPPPDFLQALALLRAAQTR